VGDVIGDILPMAVGVAVSPVPIAAVIVMLFTPKAKTNAPAFMIGWIVGLLLVGGIVLIALDSKRLRVSHRRRLVSSRAFSDSAY